MQRVNCTVRCSLTAFKEGTEAAGEEMYLLHDFVLRRATETRDQNVSYRR